MFRGLGYAPPRQPEDKLKSAGQTKVLRNPAEAVRVPKPYTRETKGLVSVWKNSAVALPRGCS